MSSDESSDEELFPIAEFVSKLYLTNPSMKH